MNKRVILLLAVILTTVLFPAVASAQEDDEVVTCEHPRVVYLVEKTGSDCQAILDLHNDGVGFGQMVKAAVVAEGLEGFDGVWADLLTVHQEVAG